MTPKIMSDVGVKDAACCVFSVFALTFAIHFPSLLTDELEYKVLSLLEHDDAFSGDQVPERPALVCFVLVLKGNGGRVDPGERRRTRKRGVRGNCSWDECGKEE